MKKLLLLLSLSATLTACSSALPPSDSPTIDSAPADPPTISITETNPPAAETSIVEAATVKASATTTETEQTESPTTSDAESTNAYKNAILSLDEARQIFATHHPDAQIEVAKQEGDIYYIQGQEHNTIHKMKIDIFSGELYLNKSIQTSSRAH